LALEDQHFVDCVRDNITPQCDGLSGLSVVAVLEATDQSLRTGGPVEVGCPSEIGQVPVAPPIPLPVELR
jgi:hypothetical protein